MRIRAMKAEDIPEVSRLYAKSWKAAYPGLVPQDYLDQLREDHWVPVFQKWLPGGQFEYLVLCEGDTIIGAANFGPSREEKWRDWGEIVSLYLLPSHYGRGCGSLLMGAVLERMSEMGFSHVFLWVLEGNERAMRFYRKNGFTATEDTLICEVGGEKLTDLRYVRKL